MTLQRLCSRKPASLFPLCLMTEKSPGGFTHDCKAAVERILGKRAQRRCRDEVAEREDSERKHQVWIPASLTKGPRRHRTSRRSALEKPQIKEILQTETPNTVMATETSNSEMFTVITCRVCSQASLNPTWTLGFRRKSRQCNVTPIDLHLCRATGA